MEAARSALARLCLVTADGAGKIERVDTVTALQRHRNEGSPDSFGKFHIFVFRIDDKDFGSEHQRSQDLEFHGEGFTRTGGGKYRRVGIREIEPVENDE